MSLLDYLRQNPGCTALAEGAVHAVAPLLEDPDPEPFLRELDAWTDHLIGCMPLPWNLHKAIDAVNDFLFRDLGFRGDREAFDAPENAALPLVLRRRKGLPIALSILWIETCRRLGLDAVGVSLPGHFIAALRTDTGLLCFDPFHGGRALGEERAAELVQQATGGRISFTRDLLSPAPDRAILVRLVRNLHVRYGQVADWPNALWTATHLVLLDPKNPDAYRDRAMIHFHRGDLRAAAVDLRQALELTPGGDVELETWFRNLSGKEM